MLDIFKMLHLHENYLWSRKMKMDLDRHRHICILFAALFLCWLNLPSESRLFYKITNDNLSQQKYKSIENKFSSYSSLLSYMFPRCPDFSCNVKNRTLGPKTGQWAQPHSIKRRLFLKELGITALCGTIFPLCYSNRSTSEEKNSNVWHFHNSFTLL